MGYLGHGWRALCYLLLPALVAALFLAGLLLMSFTLAEGRTGRAWRMLGFAVAVGLVDLVLLQRRRADRPRRRPWYSRWLGPPVLLLPITIAFLARLLVLQPFPIAAGSMRPSLLPGDQMLAAKYAYGYGRFVLPRLTGDRMAGRLPRRVADEETGLPARRRVD